MNSIARVDGAETHSRESCASPSADAARTLLGVQRLSDLLDNCIAVPGTNFKIGWDVVIGLIPGVGDLVTAGLSTWLIWKASQLGASNWTLLRMTANVGVDALVGAIPFAGDFFDAAFRANRRNVRLLKRHLEEQRCAADEIIDVDLVSE